MDDTITLKQANVNVLVRPDTLKLKGAYSLLSDFLLSGREIAENSLIYPYSTGGLEIKDPPADVEAFINAGFRQMSLQDMLIAMKKVR